MVSGGAVDGLVSGLDTAQLISQLMQAEAAPQTALKRKVVAENKVIGAYQSVNTKMAALLTAAQDLGKATAWQSAKATSSSAAVVATASETAQAGSLTFEVKSLAASQSSFSYGTTNSLTAQVTSGGGPFQLLLATGPVAINVGDGSLQAVVSGINASGAPVKAAAVQTAPGEYRLQLTGTGTGADTWFAVDGLGGFGLDPATGEAFVNATEASDARLVIGPPGSTIDVVSPTNTFNDIMPGVILTAVEVSPSVTINVSRDTEAIAGKVQALVDAANAALSEISKQSSQGSEGVGKGPLAGDFAVRRLGQQILDTVSHGAGGLGSLKAVGIELTRDGTLSFDKQAFLDSYTEDPALAQSYFDSYTDSATAGTAAKFDPGRDTATGLARRLDALSLITTTGLAAVTGDAGTAKGTLQATIDSRTDKVRDLNDRILGWDARLEVRRIGLQRQFTNMETALGKLKSQSTWLSGQIASLPSW